MSFESSWNRMSCDTTLPFSLSFMQINRIAFMSALRTFGKCYSLGLRVCHSVAFARLRSFAKRNHEAWRMENEEASSINEILSHFMNFPQCFSSALYSSLSPRFAKLIWLRLIPDWTSEPTPHEKSLQEKTCSKNTFYESLKPVTASKIVFRQTRWLDD